METLQKFYALERSGILSSTEPILQVNDPKQRINRRMMVLIKDWAFAINRGFKLIESTYTLFLEIIDIVVRKIEINSRELQLYGIVSHLIAAKFIEVHYPYIQDYIYSSDNAYTIRQIKEKEIEVFKILNYNIYLPIGRYFRDLYLNIIEDKIFTYKESEFSKYLLYIYGSFGDGDLYLPSIIALSCIYIGSKVNGNDYLDLLIDISGYNENEILYCANIVWERYKMALSRKRDSIKEYFSTKKKIDVRGFYRTEIVNLENLSSILRPQYRVRERQREEDIYFIQSEGEDVILGSGSYSTVYKVEYQGIIKAYKVMNCEYNTEGIDHSDLREISFLKTVSCTNIVDMNYVNIDDQSCISIILELLEIDLSHLIKEDNLNINLIKRYSLQIVNAVKCLKDLGILHRDIKPENILVKGEDIKLADFGLSYPYVNVFYKRSKETEMYTVLYRPIELFLGETKYSFEADVWATGVTIAEMLRKYPIFYPEEVPNRWGIKSMTTTILKFLGTQTVKDSLPDNEDIKLFEDFEPDTNYNDFFNTDDNLLIDLLTRMIVMTDDRITIEECINHPWFIR